MGVLKMFSRPTIIAGNWKMHKTISEALQFVNEFIPLVKNRESQVFLASPFTCLSAVAEEVCEEHFLKVGAQTLSVHEEGAWTGEISGRMLKEAGAEFVIIGHSERRQHHAETNSIVNQKLRLALLASLQPIVCVGETLAEREKDLTFSVIENQLRECLAGVSLEDASNLIIAYEPIWAIGTGKNSSPGQAQIVHRFCREILEKIWSSELAQKTPIIYGGSVNVENSTSLIAQPDVDGLLVGGASLNAHIFSQIVNANVNHQVV